MDDDPRDDQQAAIEAERLRKLLQMMRLPRWNAPLGRVSNHPARDKEPWVCQCWACELERVRALAMQASEVAPDASEDR